MDNTKSQSPIRVLIVDDSASVRDILKEIFGQTNDMTVIGEAENGLEAIEKAMILGPDLITMDITMPQMSGHDAIKEIMATRAVPILVISSMDDAQTSMKAVANGALDLFPKSDIISDEFVEKARLVASVKVITHLRGKRKAPVEVFHKPPERITALAGPKSPEGKSTPLQDKIVAIASSTGGPQALGLVLSAIPSDFAYPIVIAQHIALGFTDGLVDVLAYKAHLPVVKGKVGEKIEPGCIYVSPSSAHMIINQNRKIELLPRQNSDIYFPSCNHLLSSAARVYGNGVIGVVLTGMGSDGVVGIRDIKKEGGKTIAQDESTSVIFGMPKEAIATGCVDVIVPIQNVSAELLAICKNRV
jgi:two-component system, chemotaxis family, protein-glutamate methylesterase/glutaminase